MTFVSFVKIGKPSFHNYRVVYSRIVKTKLKLLLLLVILHSDSMTIKKARQCHLQALEIQRAIGYRVGEGASLMRVAQVRIREGDYDKAEKLLKDALRIQEAFNDQWQKAVVWSELGVLYLFIGEWAKTIESLQYCLDLFESLEAQIAKAYVLCNLGQVFREQGEVQRAKMTLQDGIKIARSQKDKNLEALYLSDLAQIEFDIQSYPEAIDYSRKALCLFRKMDLDVLTTSDLTLLSLAYLGMGKHIQAAQSARQALDILNKSNGEEQDYPQRDYFRCYKVFSTLNQSQQARSALQFAYGLLTKKAEKISDLAMRHSFLQNVSFNREILQEANRVGIAKDTGLDHTEASCI
ncbi:tetratricopeptide repeat protein [Chloroflexi bacterium TSY]|nr:tetratricopeptide repeat protein [Chloroflexi bacterium TSY]